MQNGVTRLVDVGIGGAEANGDINQTMPTRQTISSDGRYVAFASMASNLVPGDTNGGNDVFVRDLVEGETTRVSVSSSGAQTFPTHPQWALNLALNATGSVVAFTSTAPNLVPGLAPSDRALFVRDMVSGVTRAITNNSGALPNNYTGSPSISDDGTMLAFESVATNFSPSGNISDNDNYYGAYVTQIGSGVVTPVSVNSNGSPAGSTGAMPQISADGTEVMFVSRSPGIVSGDTNAVLGDRFSGVDAFVRNLTTGETTRVSVGEAGEQLETERNGATFWRAYAVDDLRYLTFDCYCGGARLKLMKNRISGALTPDLAGPGELGQSTFSRDLRYRFAWAPGLNAHQAMRFRVDL